MEVYGAARSEGFSPAVIRTQRSKQRAMQALSVFLAGVALAGIILVAADPHGSVELQSRMQGVLASSSPLQQLADEAPAEGSPPPAEAPAASVNAGDIVTFPGDYPNSVRHFLLIGWAMFAIGAGVLFYVGTWSLAEEKRTILHPVSFLSLAFCAMAYYAMYVGLGAEFQGETTPPRVVFPARYSLHLVAVPATLLSLALFTRCDVVTTVSLLGCDVLSFATLFMMGVVTTPQRYLWWIASLLFFCAVVPSLLTLLGNTEAQMQPKIKPLIWILVLGHCAILAASLAGAEGTSALGLSQEVGLLTAVDLITIVAPNFWLVIQQNAEGTVWA
jgi:bacteriorhodopsin